MGCRFGDKCYLSHSNPNSIRLCPLISTASGCHYGRMCYDRHKVYSDDVSANELKDALKEKETVFMTDIKRQISAMKNSLYRHHASSLEMMTAEQRSGIVSKSKATLLTAANALDTLQEQLVDHSKTRQLLYKHLDKMGQIKQVVVDTPLKTNPFLNGDGKNGDDGEKAKENGGAEKENVNGLNQRKRSRTEMMKESVNGHVVAVESDSNPKIKRMRIEKETGSVPCSGTSSVSDDSIEHENRGTFEFDG